MVMSSHEVLCEGSIVADHLNTDWDLGPEKICYGNGSGSRLSFDMDSDPGKNETDPDPGKKGFSTRKI